MTASPQTTYDIRPVLQDDDLHVWEHAGQSRRLVACFSGIGVKGKPAPGYEFARTATQSGRDTVLFFADPQRSWLNRPGLIEQIVDRMERKARDINANQIVTLGHSMGGYSAAIIPGFTKVDTAVCLSPQTSVHPQVVVDDKRWMDYRNDITHHRIRSVADHIVPDTQYYVFFGSHGREAPQRDRFPMAANINFFIMPRTVHNTPVRLKNMNMLDQVVQSGFGQRTRLVRRLLKTNFSATQIMKPTKAMQLRAQEQNAAASAN
ncbi:MAG: hypothetical protein WBC93_07940 [Sulfitobacter sp.]